MEGLNYGCEHIRLFDVFPRDIITIRLRQLADELTLRPPIAFTEGMERVQLAEIVRNSTTEVSRAKSGKVLFFRKLRQDRRGCGVDVGVVSKQITTLADVCSS